MKYCSSCNVYYTDEKRFCKECGGTLISDMSENSLDPKSIAQSSVYEDKIKADPLNVILLFEYAQFLYNKLLFKEAITILLKILAIDENDSNATSLLYMAYMKVGNLNDAADIGEKLLQNNPVDVNLLSDLADIAIKKNKDKEALSYLIRIIHINPKDKVALIKKAMQISKKGNEKDIFEAWGKVHEIDPSNPVARFYLAIESYDKQDYKNIALLLEPVINQLQNDQDEAILYYCLSIIKTDNKDSRIPELIKKINFNSFIYTTNPRIKKIIKEIYIYIGDGNLSNKQYEEALIYFNKANEINQTECCKELIAKTNYKYAIDDLQNKIFWRAKKNAEKALMLFPDNIEYLALLDKIAQNIRASKRKTILRFSIITVTILFVVFSIFLYNYLKQQSDWKHAKKENTYNSYQDYLNKYKTGRYFSEAIALQEVVFWNETKQKNSIESVNKYLSIYEDGKYYGEAKIMKEAILWDNAIKLKSIETYENYLNEIGGISLNHEIIARKYIDSVRFIHPDIEKIKNDLIGQKIPGWNFDYLHEFSHAEVLNLTTGTDRIEYKIKFKLTDEAANSEHHCEVIVVYLKGDIGWYFNTVIMQFITYDYLVPSDSWLTITPLQNCNWSASGDKKLAWKTNDWGSISYSGPGMKKLTLTSSSRYLIKSMEGHPITVRFTYLPSN